MDFSLLPESIIQLLIGLCYAAAIYGGAVVLWTIVKMHREADQPQSAPDPFFDAITEFRNDFR